MNCPNCKNPVEDNATVCEWCGVSITPKSLNTVNAMCLEVFGPLNNGVSILETPCPNCNTPNTIHSKGHFRCSVCKNDFFHNDSVYCPKCSKQIVFTNNLDSLKTGIFRLLNVKCPFCGKSFNFKRNKK
jgi:endogenous inhibitor of DNA gyrase (YacG/DUF329 family)